MSSTLTEEQLDGLATWIAARKHVPQSLLYDRLHILLTALRVTRAALQESAETGVTLLRERVALRDEAGHLRAELTEYEDDRRAVLAEPCDGDDRKHCSCVPHLRAELEQLQLQLAIREG